MGGLVEVASGDAGKPRRMCRMAGAALVEAGPPSRAAHAERVPAGVPLSPATTRPAPGPLHRSGHERDRTGMRQPSGGRGVTVGLDLQRQVSAGLVQTNPGRKM